ncbi:Transposon Ty3-G Gag-Pol poly [Labeo rohita]|uniref:Transposon Ty3-G Gag-Pol poly n=1 Tax=Labeo rohita TaxID=84645 RepID=A0A498NJ25_LABRO|nr:Transposon Ty3-G Gag-Pol poly [Labeo rohita]
MISAEGISPDPMKAAAVRNMMEPSNVSELRSFLGMVNQLGRFIPKLADKDKALRDLLSKKNCWIWGMEQAKDFQTLKDALLSPPVLGIYDPNRDRKMSADASSYGLGAVIMQRWQEGWNPIAYASRSLTQTEQRYAQVEKEALGLTWACERFRDFLIGKHFEMETDHKPLLSLLGSQALDALPPRFQRFKMRLMRYSYSIVHVPGKSLWVADTLSRTPVKQDIVSGATKLTYAETELKSTEKQKKKKENKASSRRSGSDGLNPVIVGVSAGLTVTFLIVVFLVLLWCYRNNKGSSSAILKFNDADYFPKPVMCRSTTA